MGKHSIRDERVYWHSAGEALRPWLMVLLVPLLAIVGWRAAANGNEGDARGESQPRPGAGAARASRPETGAAQRASQGAPVSSSSVPARATSADREQTSANAQVSRRAVKVQVLNGTADPRLGAAVAWRLRKAGYDVVAVGTATQHHDRTVLFCQKGFAKPGGELGDLLHIKNRKEAPGNLDPSIPLTVVVGDDYRQLQAV